MKTTVIILFLISLFLASCGKDNVCIAGIGQCAVDKNIEPHVADSDLILVSDVDTLKVTQQATFTASRGRAPYRFIIDQGYGSLDQEHKTGTTIVFTAPSYAGTTTVRVIDANNNYKTHDITVQP